MPPPGEASLLATLGGMGVAHGLYPLPLRAAEPASWL